MSSQVEGLNSGPLDYKLSTLTTMPGHLLLLQDQKQSLQGWSQPARQASERFLRDLALKLFLPKTCRSFACLHHCWLRISGFCHSCINWLIRTCSKATVIHVVTQCIRNAGWIVKAWATQILFRLTPLKEMINDTFINFLTTVSWKFDVCSHFS